ncbi:hypothetical protein [Bacillus thuringiensis]|uniref:hypothetical protein n=1 Tax=Bacillus thuringiensis TaxID=1428 RepID=UPI00217597D2|nr:hypothetical protein [Bacillus thuringiensis]
MADANMIVRERQLAIRREMDRRGISLKAVSLDSGIPYQTVVSYFPGEKDKQPATLPGSALFLLAEKGAMPLDLLSLVLPAGFQIVRAPEELDHDALCELAADYVAAKRRAHHPESEAGREIGPNEQADLTGKVVHFARSLAA